MAIERDGDTIVVTRPTERGEDRALHGLTRTLVANMVEGVTKGFEKRLEIQGVGYRAALRGTDARAERRLLAPVVIGSRGPGSRFEVPAPTQVVVKGIDKQQVGQIAAEIRKVRPPEPYKGKGIRYEGEYVRRQGRGSGPSMSDRLHASARGARSAATAASAARCPARPSGRGSSSSARTAASRRSSSTTSPAGRSLRRPGST